MKIDIMPSHASVRKHFLQFTVIEKYKIAQMGDDLKTTLSREYNGENQLNGRVVLQAIVMYRCFTLNVF